MVDITIYKGNKKFRGRFVWRWKWKSPFWIRIELWPLPDYDWQWRTTTLGILKPFKFYYRKNNGL